MLLFGASGHAKVIIGGLEANNEKKIFLFDDDTSKAKILQYEVLGKYDENKFIDEKLIISIGYNEVRYKLTQIIKHNFGKMFHPSAIISNYATIKEGTVIFQNAVIQPDVKIGKHVIINTLTIIEHDSIIEDFVHVAPNSTICGGVQVGEGTLIGAGSTVIPNVRIGKWCIIGAGTTIRKNVPDYSVIVGNPAKIIKKTNKIENEKI